MKDTVFALSAPIIIILGVVFGIVTLVEVAVLANFYILLIRPVCLPVHPVQRYT